MREVIAYLMSCSAQPDAGLDLRVASRGQAGNGVSEAKGRKRSQNGYTMRDTQASVCMCARVHKPPCFSLTHTPPRGRAHTRRHTHPAHCVQESLSFLLTFYRLFARWHATKVYDLRWKIRQINPRGELDWLLNRINLKVLVITFL